MKIFLQFDGDDAKHIIKAWEITRNFKTNCKDISKSSTFSVNDFIKEITIRESNKVIGENFNTR